MKRILALCMILVMMNAANLTSRAEEVTPYATNIMNINADLLFGDGYIRVQVCMRYMKFISSIKLPVEHGIMWIVVGFPGIIHLEILLRLRRTIIVR